MNTISEEKMLEMYNKEYRFQKWNKILDLKRDILFVLVEIMKDTGYSYTSNTLAYEINSSLDVIRDSINKWLTKED